MTAILRWILSFRVTLCLAGLGAPGMPIGGGRVAAAGGGV